MLFVLALLHIRLIIYGLVSTKHLPAIDPIVKILSKMVSLIIKISTLFCLILPLLMFSVDSFALGKQGHQLVCQLAFEHLSSSKQTQITEILQQIPEQDKRAILRFNHKNLQEKVNFANACTWADAIKEQNNYQHYKSWHYLNTARNTTTITPKACRKNCLTQAILFHQQQLNASAQLDSTAQWQALLFVGHWLGDIHQPLHISYASDLGGNKTFIKTSSKQCTNLHWFWDSCLLQRANRSYAHWMKLLNEQWVDSKAPPWQPGQVWLWADESYQLVRSPDFGYCQLIDGKTCVEMTKNNLTLPSNYQQQYLPVIEKRIVLAAQRLTALLEASL